jgi:hypothetical protein
LAAYENWTNLLAQLITLTVFASGIVQLLSGTIFLPGHAPGVDSASKRNEYQVFFLGVKAAGA